MDESGIAAAADALGLTLEELREAAQENGLTDFRRFLRVQAMKRLQALRTAKKPDPFEWDAPVMATVPAFVENRMAVEALYHSLREEAALGLPYEE